MYNKTVKKRFFIATFFISAAVLYCPARRYADLVRCWLPMLDSVPAARGGTPDKKSAGFSRIPEFKFYTLSLKVDRAKEVSVAGDFNKWQGEKLHRKDSGWEIMKPLPPGDYKYLCYADGKEMLDPMNPKTAEENGKKYSVFTVK